MEFLKTLFGGGRRRKSRRLRKRGGAACESGEACATQFSADSSLSQGETFLQMNKPYHGGKRRTRHRRMRGGAADLAVAFETAPADIHQMSGTAVLDSAIADLAKFTPTHQAGGRRRSRRQRGGHADLEAAFQAPSAELNEAAGTSVLDTAMAQLEKLNPFKGGARRSRRRRGGAMLGNSPIDAPSMLLRPEDYSAAFLNPQWVQENVVNPNFHGPDNAYVAPTTGGKRKSRKATRKGRKGSRKATTRKCPRGKTYRKTFIRKGRRIMGKCVRK